MASSNRDPRQEHLNFLVEKCKNFPTGPTYSTHSNTMRYRDITKKAQATRSERSVDHPDPMFHIPDIHVSNQDSQGTAGSFSPGDFRQFENNDLSTFLMATIDELKKSNLMLNKIAHKQQKLLETHDKLIDECKHRISDLEFEVDDLKQERLSTSILVTGPSIANFIQSSSEHKDGMKNIAFHSLNTLRTLIATKSVDRDLLSDVLQAPPIVSSEVATPTNAEDGEQTQQTDPASNIQRTPDVSKHPAVVSLITEQQVDSATILSDNRLLVRTKDRSGALAILTRGRHARHSMNFAEQLTKPRQGLMFKLRELRRDAGLHHPKQKNRSFFAQRRSSSACWQLTAPFHPHRRRDCPICKRTIPLLRRSTRNSSEPPHTRSSDVQTPTGAQNTSK